MLILAVSGAAFTGADRPAMTFYWVVLSPVFGIICVVAHWRKYHGLEAHWQLVRKQVLHWTAVMFTMYIAFMANVKQMLAVPAVAWLEQSTLLLLLGAVVVGAFAILLFSYYRGRHADIQE